ncbi:hypothetical protein ACLD02_02980 [Alloalcanivorax sp. C16-2]|uniref:hypothetical protein n=1 Tax=Alloalcanivorax sp. C16-2 TaxID=3390052 RepID=UPI0039705416
MIYFSIKSDRKFLESYYQLAKWFLSNKEKTFSGGSVDEINYYLSEVGSTRESLARGLPKAKRLADIFEIPVLAFDPAHKVKHHAFSTILNNDADGLISDDQKLDLLNETIGACGESERTQLLKLINPFFWLGEAISKVLRFPFWVLGTAGFKSESFEKSLAGSVVRLIELVAIISFLIYLGFSETELKEAVKALINV